jgi:hypothetical protein
MIRHKRRTPLSHDYLADLGMRWCPEEGGPNIENSTLINGFMQPTRSFMARTLTVSPRPARPLVTLPTQRPSSCSSMKSRFGCPTPTCGGST